MATISMNGAGTTHVSRHGNVKTPYLVEVEVDLADVLAAKGSALIATDVIETLTIPANTIVIGGMAQVKTASDATTLTVTLGHGADPDAWAATVDGKVAGSTDGLAAFKVFDSADTVDLTIATLTGTATSGVIRVAVLVVDATDAIRAGIAQLGS